MGVYGTITYIFGYPSEIEQKESHNKDNVFFYSIYIFILLGNISIYISELIH